MRPAAPGTAGSGTTGAAPAIATLADYDLGEVLGLEPLPSGSPAARKVRTTRGSFVLKPVYRAADIELQSIAGPLLTSRGIRQPAIIATAAGQLVSKSGYFLQEFLAGSAPSRPSAGQTAAAMRHVAAFHLALGELGLSYQADRGSAWVQVTDREFLVAELPGLLASSGLADESASRAVRYLDRCGADLASLPGQLVHGDIGPDNVLMDGAAVVAIIDFTPHLLPVLLAASTALYWYHVYGRSRVDAGQLAASAAAMDSVRPWNQAERALLPAGLAWEGLRRLATPLELARRQDQPPGPSARLRLAALRALVGMLPELGAEM